MVQMNGWHHYAFCFFQAGSFVFDYTKPSCAEVGSGAGYGHTYHPLPKGSSGSRRMWGGDGIAGSVLAFASSRSDGPSSLYGVRTHRRDKVRRYRTIHLP